MNNRPTTILTRALWATVATATALAIAWPVSGQTGSTNRKLSGDTPVFTDIMVRFGWLRPQISNNSQYVVYAADAVVDEQLELFSVPLSGATAPMRLNANLAANGNVRLFAITADSQRVVYIAPQVARDEIYSVSITGGAQQRLNSPLANPTTGRISDFRIAPNNTQVVFWGSQEAGQNPGLYSVSINGGIVVRLNPPLTGGRNIAPDTGLYSAGGYFSISPDSQYVVYLADQTTDGVFELWSVSINGGIPVRLNADLPLNGDIEAFTISPDSTRVIYWGDQTADEVRELYSAPIEGGDPIKLNSPLVRGGNVVRFKIAPDSSRVVYQADQNNDETFELFSTPLTSSAPVRLNGDLPVGADVTTEDWGFTITPAGLVVYRANQTSVDRADIFSIPVAGGTPTRLTASLPVGSAIFYAGANGSRLLIGTGGFLSPGTYYSVAATGGPVVELVPREPYNAPQVSPDGTRFVFMDGIGDNSLYSAPLTGGRAVRLHPPLIDRNGFNIGDLFDQVFYISPDSNSVVYVTDQDARGVDELYVTVGVPTPIQIFLPGLAKNR